jgi:hypothetical protein
MVINEVAVEVQLAEAYPTSFMTLWILVQISWKIFIDYHFLFTIPVFGILNKVLLAA